ncbi:MAG: SGNH/GDSL hydrolase family protein [Corynebacterium sp.]|nr:SGNH/GDSL hydrolase family protein [Corynebacterium sp.]
MIARIVGALGLALTLGAGSANALEVINDPNFIRPLTSSTNKWVTPAQPGGYDTVVLGDSQSSGQMLPIWADDRGCQRSDFAWPEQLRKIRGLSEAQLYNASCPGASLNSSGLHLSDLVRRTQEFNGIGAKTKHIYIQLGANDVWGNKATSVDTNFNCLLNPMGSCTDKDVAANKVQDARAVTAAEYAKRVKPVVDYLKYYAPNAKISIVSYVSTTAFGNPNVCINVLGHNQRRYAPALSAFQEALYHAQKGAAEELGLTFVDLKTLTQGHESCTSQPWVHGIGDPHLKNLGFWWHPSAGGDHVTASHISSAGL